MDIKCSNEWMFSNRSARLRQEKSLRSIHHISNNMIVIFHDKSYKRPEEEIPGDQSYENRIKPCLLNPYMMNNLVICHYNIHRLTLDCNKMSTVKGSENQFHRREVKTFSRSLRRKDHHCQQKKMRFVVWGRKASADSTIKNKRTTKHFREPLRIF